MENLIHPNFRNGTDTVPPLPLYYYFPNGRLMKSITKIPDKSKYVEPFIIYNEDYNYWYVSLKNCDINETEVDKMFRYLGTKTMFGTDFRAHQYSLGKPIEVTDILVDNNGVITFKRPKDIHVIIVDEPKPHQAMLLESDKYHGHTLEYWKNNAEENYITTPISVLKYITILEEIVKKYQSHV